MGVFLIHAVSAISATVQRVTGGPSVSNAAAMTKRAATEITAGNDLRSLVICFHPSIHLAGCIVAFCQRIFRLYL